MTAPPIPAKSPLRKDCIASKATGFVPAQASSQVSVKTGTDEHYNDLGKRIDEVLELVKTGGCDLPTNSDLSAGDPGRSTYSESTYSEDCEDHTRTDTFDDSRSSMDSSYSSFSFTPDSRMDEPTKPSTGCSEYSSRVLKSSCGKHEQCPRIRESGDDQPEDLESLPILTADQMFDMIDHIPMTLKPGKQQYEEATSEFSFRPMSVEPAVASGHQQVDTFEVHRSNSLQRSFGILRRASVRSVIEKVRS